MKIKQLQTLLDSQPSVAGSTFMVGAFYVLAWILAAAFLILGLGLLLESALEYRVFLDWVSRQLKLALTPEQRTGIAASLGLISVFLGVVFVGVIFLSRMVLKRNHHIIQTEEWLYSNISELRRTARKSASK